MKGLILLFILLNCFFDFVVFKTSVCVCVCACVRACVLVVIPGKILKLGLFKHSFLTSKLHI